ncbi:type IV toxin-antitoxin system AbiEi family antitoxin domain-containing protein [Cupriavidus sp. UYPR2.512]|uniref:type IV toxin-antitoxin system AbiEi family antitoxin domain-containing protein n=1 Tax=Cupriavidus sp. UYPR2.512 TaxID=1080187 RepID=UPI000477033F|nr:type IV toxin-antitoxin system AbiEi family antitoxin domain-containing protein [Cupriavidus sp. UYPR2.512]UIF89205.1 type IV toxin-antitoxin system AbiEi family antitoxin domain-containing protein [Cupriavidus necator]
MRNKPLHNLLAQAPRGQPMDTEMLREMGVSERSLSHMVSEAWLEQLGRSAYLLRGDTPTLEGILAYLSRRIKGLHVGGKTALDWQGVRHNIAFRERVVLWGQVPYRFPEWVDKHLLYTYQRTDLFDDSFPYGEGLKALPNRNPSVLVSVPERAFLELVSDVGKGQTLEEVENIIVMMRSLRPPILRTFLSHCTRLKVLKLVKTLGEDSGFAWGQNLQEHVQLRVEAKQAAKKLKAASPQSP